MAFEKKTWKNRIAEYINRRLLTKEDGSTELVTVARDEGQVSQEGDAFNADNMNDLEQRISDEFDSLNQSLNDTKKSVSDGKSSIASAITNNGVTTASDATFATLASSVQALATNRYNVGRTQGRSDVTGSPNSYSLYTKSQYDSNYTSGYNAGVSATENKGGNCAIWLYGASSSLKGLYYDENCFSRSGNTLYIKKSGTYYIATTGYTTGSNVNVNGNNRYVGDISAYNGGYSVYLSQGQYITSNMTTSSSGGACGAVCVKKS